jgi:GDP-4-dehydro-6-deoxy-D-mannose reductase
VRPFNHIGPGQSPDYVTASFARQIVLAEAGVSTPTIQVGNLSARRDFTDVRDVVEAYILLMDHGTSGQAYNIGSGKAIAIQTILDTLLSHSQIKIKIEQDPARMRPVDQPISYGDIQKINRELGWHPKFSLEESLYQILDYWRHQINRTSSGC